MILSNLFGRTLQKKMFFHFIAFLKAAIPLKPDPLPFHFESFQDDSWKQHWQITSLPNYTGTWEFRETKTPQAIKHEKMIYMANESSYYGISTKFDTPLDLTNQTLVVQYEVRIEDSFDCGGAYIKLFGNENFDSPATMSNETRYVIMFGPDKCGDTNKVHFIFRHLGRDGKYEEKHMNEPPQVKDDKISHIYTLIVRPDNSFNVLIDGSSEKSGNLLNDFTPSVNPPKTIDDPTDKKPDDWVDEEMIDDMSAVKPDDWDESQPEYIPDPEKKDPPEGWLTDEPRFIPDPEAKQPEDWDVDVYGEWEAPTIANPKCSEAPGCCEYEPPMIYNENYRGKWERPQIENPNYKGPWKARQIPNPDYYEDPDPHNFRPILGAGFELWMVNKNIGISNVYIGTDEAAVKTWNSQNFIPKHGKQEAEQKNIDNANNNNNDNNNDNNGNTNSNDEDDQTFQGALKKFGSTIKDAWENLCETNQAAAVAISIALIAVPTLLLVFYAFSKAKREADAAAAAAKQKKPKKKLTPEEKAKRAARREARRAAKEKKLAEEKEKNENNESGKEEEEKNNNE